MKQSERVNCAEEPGSGTRFKTTRKSTNILVEISFFPLCCSFVSHFSPHSFLLFSVLHLLPQLRHSLPPHPLLCNTWEALDSKGILQRATVGTKLAVVRRSRLVSQGLLTGGQLAAKQTRTLGDLPR